MTETVVELDGVGFERSEQPLLRTGGLTASAFRYDSGVAGLRVRHAGAEVELLPYQGQQVWRARMSGRELTMRSMFSEPLPTREYLGTYGGLLLHCGALATGNPGPADDHPLHGELPNAPYRRAQLIAGQDAAGSFLTLTGRYEHVTAFGSRYLAVPRLTIRDGSTRLTTQIAIRNLGQRAMPLMYLAHVNFAPVDGARMIDSAAAGDVQVVEPGRRVDPEQVTSRRPRAGADGWALALQLHPDGRADFVRHRPAELDHVLRWFVRTGDEDALGLALPATAEAEGFTRESEKGNVRWLGAGETFAAAVEFGALDASEGPAAAAGMSNHGGGR